ncbi:MAG: HDIG domain-containing protein [Proteobacteria bacterium]|nr:HDIG domain-containing protein [Pseudomonadota bacterium]
MSTREHALKLLRENVKNERTLAHCLASEAVLRALAQRFSGDGELWGLAGLLHDLDYEGEGQDPARHGDAGADMILAGGFDPKIARTVRMHNAEGLGLSRDLQLDHALCCGESVTGLIVAAALVHPDKKLASVKTKSVKKRMKAKDFARAVSRERIAECEKIGLPVDEFLEIALAAMQGIAEELGL